MECQVEWLIDRQPGIWSCFIQTYLVLEGYIWHADKVVNNVRTALTLVIQVDVNF